MDLECLHIFNNNMTLFQLLGAPQVLLHKKGRQSMKFSMLFFLLALLSALPAAAETYKWTDSKGVVNFTDNPAAIPPKYRGKAKAREDITIRNPKVQKELKEQEERARQNELATPRIVPTPDNAPPPTPPLQATKPPTASDELPPGRTKSQRIRDNIERREQEEKSGQSGGQ